MEIHDVTRKAINETADLITEKGHNPYIQEKIWKNIFQKNIKNLNLKKYKVDIDVKHI